MYISKIEPETKLRADKDGWVNPCKTGEWIVTVNNYPVSQYHNIETYLIFMYGVSKVSFIAFDTPKNAMLVKVNDGDALKMVERMKGGE